MVYPLLAQTACEIGNTQDILDCALNKHPDIVNAANEAARDGSLIRVASQRPNPELDSEIIGGKNADDTLLNSQTFLLHTLELGGKRKARIQQANVLIDRSSLNLREKRQEGALQTVLTLYRLREIRAELDCANEAYNTFDKILSSFKQRPRLTPEQDVSKISFELVREEYRLKRTTLMQEQANLEYLLELITEIPYLKMANHLPPFKNKWPEAVENRSNDASSNTTIAKAKAEQKLAESNIRLARSKAWPDLKIGPGFATESLTSKTDYSGGLGFSVPLPLLNLNRGEKAFANADKVWADTNLEISIRKTGLGRAIQLQRYRQAVKALQQSRPDIYHVTQHRDIESFFEKGLVPSTLVIEAHRQMYEFTKTRNEQELTGIDALWRLYIIDGTVFNEKI
ncbi:MAG: TolC family protein [Deltaproteobacteria bacterium]|nr:TolC family protein [Deltaproteobacteria bacterium]